MSTERFFIADPYNDEHIRLISDFEETNEITTVTSTLLRNIRQTRTEEKYKIESRESNEIHQSLFLQKDNAITDTCHIQGEKDIKACKVFFAPISQVKDRKLIDLATNYAFDVLGMNDVFVILSKTPRDQLLGLSLKQSGYENLGEENGNITYLKEKEFTNTKGIGTTLAA